MYEKQFELRISINVQYLPLILHRNSTFGKCLVLYNMRTVFLSSNVPVHIF